jgi:glycine/D-amino acid oxidase-like deaminating enzyme
MISKKIIVLGAGVSGLTTAILLLERGFEIKIVAEFFPGDVNPNYTSPRLAVLSFFNSFEFLLMKINQKNY